MAPWLRRAGRGRFEDGRTVVWSVAEGRRGWRWREVVRTPDPAGIRHSLLLEIDPAGSFAHLELSTETGLLTLHPEGDGTLHGNAVTTHGVEHVRGLSWERDGIVLIDASFVSGLAAVRGLAAMDAGGPTRNVLVARIPTDLRVRLGRETVARREAYAWSIGDLASISLDDEGLVRGAGLVDWPLEEAD